MTGFDKALVITSIVCAVISGICALVVVFGLLITEVIL